MTRRRKCTHCEKLTIPGLVNPLCQYHYNVAQFGKAWADKCRAEDEAEPTTMARVQQMVEDRWPRKPYNVWITDCDDVGGLMAAFLLGAAEQARLLLRAP